MEEPLADIEIRDASTKRKPWRLAFFEDRLRFDDGQQWQDISRQEAAERLEMLDTLVARRTLVAKVPKRTVFKLDQDACDAIVAWRGPPTEAELRVELKKRLRWTVTIGLVFVVTSLPMAGDPDHGLDPVPFDPVTLALGAGLIVLGIISKIAPQPSLFAADALWCLVLAGSMVVDVIGGRHPLWLLFALLLLSGASHAWKKYRRLRALRQEPPSQ